MAGTRRERQRTIVVDEIKQAALDEIASHGAGALSVRAIGRAIGLSPAGLYRYFDGIEALLTELITDAFGDLADAVNAAATGPPGPVAARLRDAMLAYRRWAIEQPNRFLLIFGTPIPGYRAPEEGPTTIANRRIGEVFLSLVAEGWRTGELRPPPANRPVERTEEHFAETVGHDFPAEWLGPVLGAWAHFHGMVTLEVLHHLDWIYPDAEAFYRAEAESIVAAWTV